ncbi:hypothetical protein EDB84DRAFT_1441201, partial [Lactarius hengduanensis]
IRRRDIGCAVVYFKCWDGLTFPFKVVQHVFCVEPTLVGGLDIIQHAGKGDGVKARHHGLQQRGRPRVLVSINKGIPIGAGIGEWPRRRRSSCVTYPFDTACPGPGHPHSSHPRLDLKTIALPTRTPQSRSQPPPLLSPPSVEGTVVAMVHLDDGRMDLKAITLPVRPQVLAYPWHHLRVEALIAHHPRSSCPRAMTHRVVPVVSLDDGRLDLMAIALPVRNAGITQRPRVRPIYPPARDAGIVPRYILSASIAPHAAPQSDATSATARLLMPPTQVAARNCPRSPHVVDFEGSKAAKKTSSKPTARPRLVNDIFECIASRLAAYCSNCKRARPDTGISSKATAILVNDIFERIAAAASNRPPPTAQTGAP